MTSTPLVQPKTTYPITKVKSDHRNNESCCSQAIEILGTGVLATATVVIGLYLHAGFSLEGRVTQEEVNLAAESVSNLIFPIFKGFVLFQVGARLINANYRS